MAEIVQVVLDELKRVSLAVSSLISNTLKTTVYSNTCQCSSVSEENLDIQSLQVSTDIQTSLKQFLSPEVLSSGNIWFCPSCKALSVSLSLCLSLSVSLSLSLCLSLFESPRESCFMNSALILAIQLCRSSNWGGHLIKDKT